MEPERHWRKVLITKSLFRVWRMLGVCYAVLKRYCQCGNMLDLQVIGNKGHRNIRPDKVGTREYTE